MKIDKINNKKKKKKNFEIAVVVVYPPRSNLSGSGPRSSGNFGC